MAHVTRHRVATRPPVSSPADSSTSSSGRSPDISPLASTASTSQSPTTSLLAVPSPQFKSPSPLSTGVALDPRAASFNSPTSAALLDPRASTFQPALAVPVGVSLSSSDSLEHILLNGKDAFGHLTREARALVHARGLKLIPSVHGPVNLPYSRCPSGIDAFVFSPDDEDGPWTFVLEDSDEQRVVPASTGTRFNPVPLPGNARYSQGLVAPRHRREPRTAGGVSRSKSVRVHGSSAQPDTSNVLRLNDPDQLSQAWMSGDSAASSSFEDSSEDSRAITPNTPAFPFRPSEYQQQQPPQPQPQQWQPMPALHHHAFYPVQVQQGPPPPISAPPEWSRPYGGLASFSTMLYGLESMYDGRRDNTDLVSEGGDYMAGEGFHFPSDLLSPPRPPASKHPRRASIASSYYGSPPRRFSAGRLIVESEFPSFHLNFDTPTRRHSVLSDNDKVLADLHGDSTTERDPTSPARISPRGSFAVNNSHRLAHPYRVRPVGSRRDSVAGKAAAVVAPSQPASSAHSVLHRRSRDENSSPLKGKSRNQSVLPAKESLENLALPQKLFFETSRAHY